MQQKGSLDNGDKTAVDIAQSKTAAAPFNEVVHLAMPPLSLQCHYVMPV